MSNGGDPLNAIDDSIGQLSPSPTMNSGGDSVDAIGASIGQLNLYSSTVDEGGGPVNNIESAARISEMARRGKLDFIPSEDDIESWPKLQPILAIDIIKLATLLYSDDPQMHMGRIQTLTRMLNPQTKEELKLNLQLADMLSGAAIQAEATNKVDAAADANIAAKGVATNKAHANSNADADNAKATNKADADQS